MCGVCEGERFRGVRALFNGDLQAKGGYEDREDWQVISNEIIVFLGASALRTEENALFRGCETALGQVTDVDRVALAALSKELGRPMFGHLSH